MQCAVGPRSGEVTGRQGTAARSPKRTAGSGDARGRPAEPRTRARVPQSSRRDPRRRSRAPARLEAGGDGKRAPRLHPAGPFAAPTPGPVPVRLQPRARQAPCRQAPTQRPSDPGPLPSGPAPRPSGPGPFPSNPRPGHPRTLTPLHPHVTHATKFPGHPEATLHRPRGSNLLPDQEDGKRRGTCVRRGMQVPRRLPGPATSSAAPRGCPGTAAGARRTRPPGPPARAAPPASGARRPPPARGAGPPRPCSASTTWPARPAR